MFVWHTLVATPVRMRSRRQFCRPRMVRVKTSFFPRRSSLTTSRPSMLMSGVALPTCRRRFAIFSVMNWPFVKT